MGDTDPFSDTVFLSRLMKLVPMLGSEQPGEADNARRKLREHLAQHRLTYLDMARRLGSAGAFSQSARDNLERQLGMARAAKEEAARDARAAMARVQSLEADLQQCTFNVASTLQSQARFRALAAAGWCIAIILGALTFGSNLAKLTGLPQQAENAEKGVTNINTSGPVIMPHDPAQNDPSTHLQGHERAGRAAVQDLPIRLAPNDDATIRAFLNRGEHLAIQQEVRGPTQTWLLVRSATGTGWVRAGDVMH